MWYRPQCWSDQFRAMPRWQRKEPIAENPAKEEEGVKYESGTISMVNENTEGAENPAGNGTATKDKELKCVPLLRVQNLEEEETKSLHAWPSHLQESNLNKNKGSSMPFLDRLKSHDTSNDDDICNRGSSYFLPEQPLTPVGNDKPPNHSSAGQDNTGEEDDASIVANKRGKLTTILCYCCNLYDWKMFQDPVFVFYCLSMTASQSGYASVCMFLPPFAEEKGIAKYNVALLLSIAGFCDAIRSYRWRLVCRFKTNPKTCSFRDLFIHRRD